MSDILRILDEAPNQVKRKFDEVGEDAVRYAVEHGNYKDHTGNLRASNRFTADSERLELVNDAEYASHVESRGYDVISGAFLHMAEELAK